MATTTSDLTTVSLTLMNASGQIAATTVVTLGVEFPGPFAETPLPQPQVAEVCQSVLRTFRDWHGIPEALRFKVRRRLRCCLQFTGEQFNPVVPSNGRGRSAGFRCAR